MPNSLVKMPNSLVEMPNGLIETPNISWVYCMHHLRVQARMACTHGMVSTHTFQRDCEAYTYTAWCHTRTCIAISVCMHTYSQHACLGMLEGLTTYLKGLCLRMWWDTPRKMWWRNQLQAFRHGRLDYTSNRKSMYCFVLNIAAALCRKHCTVPTFVAYHSTTVVEHTSPWYLTTPLKHTNRPTGQTCQPLILERYIWVFEDRNRLVHDLFTNLIWDSTLLLSSA